MKNSTLFLLVAILIAVCSPSLLSAAMVETETVTTWEKGRTFNGPGNLEREFTFTDTTDLRMVVEYISVEGTEALKVNIGNSIFLDNKKAGYSDTTNVETVLPGKHKLNITAGDPKDKWFIVIYEKKVTTNLIGKTKIEKQQKKTKESGNIVKSFEMIKDKLVVKYTVRSQKRNYFWETINVDPLLPFCKEWTVKERLELAAFKNDWPEEAVNGLLGQIQIWIDSEGKKGSKLREMEEGNILDWMYSGGVKTNTITLDIGEIVVMVERYVSYYGSLSKTSDLEKDDKIQAVTFEFLHKGTIYVLLWFEGTLGGIDQCGNLAGMSYPVKTDK